MTIYAIGDIHGQLDLLRAAHDRVAADRARSGAADSPLVHVGDLVDRGPDSAGVVGYLASLVVEDTRVTVLMGNHDRMFRWFLRPEIKHDPHLRAGLTYLSPQLGGLTTLASYGVDISAPVADMHRAARAAVPQAHMDFLSSMPLSFRQDSTFLVHAGIRPGVALAEQTEGDLVWIRHEFLNDRRDHGPLVVHGHTPVEEVEHWGNRLNLDTGAAYGGPLSAVVIEGRAVFLLTDQGRVPIPTRAD